jgi:hypothetical protein
VDIFVGVYCFLPGDDFMLTNCNSYGFCFWLLGLVIAIVSPVGEAITDWRSKNLPHERPVIKYNKKCCSNGSTYTGAIVLRCFSNALLLWMVISVSSYSWFKVTDTSKQCPLPNSLVNNLNCTCFYAEEALNWNLGAASASTVVLLSFRLIFISGPEKRKYIPKVGTLRIVAKPKSKDNNNDDFPPNGWIECNGQPLNEEPYPERRPLANLLYKAPTSMIEPPIKRIPNMQGFKDGQWYIKVNNDQYNAGTIVSSLHAPLLGDDLILCDGARIDSTQYPSLVNAVKNLESPNVPNLPLQGNNVYIISYTPFTEADTIDLAIGAIIAIGNDEPIPSGWMKCQKKRTSANDKAKPKDIKAHKYPHRKELADLLDGPKKIPDLRCVQPAETNYIIKVHESADKGPVVSIRTRNHMTKLDEDSGWLDCDGSFVADDLLLQLYIPTRVPDLSSITLPPGEQYIIKYSASTDNTPKDAK